jgi:acetylglutamate kinase
MKKDGENAIRIALLTLESLVLAKGKSQLSFDELAEQYGYYGKPRAVTAEMARAAFEKHIVPVVDGLRADRTQEEGAS